MTNTKNGVKPENNKGKSRAARTAGDIVNILLLLVVISIAYSTYVVAAGTDGIEPKLLVVPQAVFATLILLKKFVK